MVCLRGGSVTETETAVFRKTETETEVGIQKTEKYRKPKKKTKIPKIRFLPPSHRSIHNVCVNSNSVSLFLFHKISRWDSVVAGSPGSTSREVLGVRLSCVTRHSCHCRVSCDSCQFQNKKTKRLFSKCGLVVSDIRSSLSPAQVISSKLCLCHKICRGLDLKSKTQRFIKRCIIIITSLVLALSI